MLFSRLLCSTINYFIIFGKVFFFKVLISFFKVSQGAILRVGFNLNLCHDFLNHFLDLSYFLIKYGDPAKIVLKTRGNSLKILVEILLFLRYFLQKFHHRLSLFPWNDWLMLKPNHKPRKSQVNYFVTFGCWTHNRAL